MNSEKRINFFGILRDTARKQSASIHLLYKHVKLSPTKGDWDNVLRHQLVQFAAAEILGEWLGLGSHEMGQFQKVALVHNWNLRLERRPQDFTPDEIKEAQMFFDSFGVDPKLRLATVPEFIEKMVMYPEKVTLEEKIQYYLDDIVAGQNIVPFKERIAEVESPRHDLNEDDELTRKLGGRKYWDAEREVGILIEKELFERLLAQGIDVSAPELIPVTLRIELEKKHGCRS